MAALARAGCVAADDEAVELRQAAAGDPERLAALLARRCSGEPLAWVVGAVVFCGQRVVVRPGVYVPRWQTEPLAHEAVARLPEAGTAVDLCTGSGAVAVVMARRRPAARVVATDVDPHAVACARDNGVEAYRADLADLAGGADPADMTCGADRPGVVAGTVDVVTAVVPYVPTGQLRLLPRDVLAYEPSAALDGGADGTRFLVAAVAAAGRLLRPGGSVLLELGGDQAEALAPTLTAHRFGDVRVLRDDDGDVRAVVATAQPPSDTKRSSES